LSFSVIIPTHDHADTLWFSVESVLQQTRQDFEIFIVGDGAPSRTREICEALQGRDPRIHYCPFEKGPRNGENNRDSVIATTSAELVCYLSDDDLWFPDHLETMGSLLRNADLAHTMQIELNPEGKPFTWIFDAGIDPLGREHLRQSLPTFGLQCGGHSLAAYRRLPIGWHAAPADMPSDFFFYRLFLEQPWCRYTSFKWPTTLHLSSVPRRAWSLPARVAELSSVASLVQNPGRRAQLIRDAFLPLLDQMVRSTGFAGDQSAVRTRIAELTGSDLRAAVPGCSPGIPLTFNNKGTAWRFWTEGFHSAEDWGAWTSNERAGLTLAIPEGVSGELRLTVVVMHLLAPGLAPSTLAIAANGKTLFETTESRQGWLTYDIIVSESVYAKAGCLALEFLSHPRSPFELGVGDDRRRLGVGLASICLDLSPGEPR